MAENGATMKMTTANHVVFFPFLAQGHAIPMIDIATILARHGLTVTIALTPFNASKLSPITDKLIASGLDVTIAELPYSSEEAGLPEEIQNLDSVRNQSLSFKFVASTTILKHPFRSLIHGMKKLQVTCIVSDFFFPWTVPIAKELGIPRVVFHGTCCFSFCCTLSLVIHKPYEDVVDEFEEFVVSDLPPGNLRLTRSRLPGYIKGLGSGNADYDELMKEVEEVSKDDAGVLVNSFVELEREYVEMNKRFAKEIWMVGPVSLWNAGEQDMSKRGKQSSVNAIECSKWLDNQKESSVVYVCFGSIAFFNEAQLIQIGLALESSPHPFIWVLRSTNTSSTKDQSAAIDNFLDELESKVKERGLIIRGWAPQLLILSHRSVGVFVTHCGWNSILEGISNGVPLITWPLFAEQHMNEVLVVDVLRVGVGVGNKRVVELGKEDLEEVIGKEKIVTAVERVLASEEGKEMRERARDLEMKAKEAVKDGGSSYKDVHGFIDFISGQ